MRTGFTTSEMSSRMPLPEHAPPASPMSGKTVMSWHWCVRRVDCVPAPWSPPAHRPAMSPVSASAKMRGMLTISARSGASRGTRTTSMRNRDVSGSSSGSAPEQPGSSSAGRGELVPWM